MVATKVFIARHGERIDHVDRDWKATAPNPDDPFLTARGLMQAEDLGKRLALEGITKIFVSPFYRTLQTAAKVAAATDAPMHVEPGMCEALLPEWFAAQPTLKALDEVKREFPSVVEDYTPVHNSVYPETKPLCAERVAKTALEIAAHETGNVLLVGHGITCENAAKALLGVSSVDFIDYCALIECVKAEESYTYGTQKGPDTSFMSQECRPVGSCVTPSK